jgi:hypothetical protein
MNHLFVSFSYFLSTRFCSTGEEKWRTIFLPFFLAHEAEQGNSDAQQDLVLATKVVARKICGAILT